MFAPLLTFHKIDGIINQQQLLSNAYKLIHKVPLIVTGVNFPLNVLWLVGDLGTC